MGGWLDLQSMNMHKPHCTKGILGYQNQQYANLSKMSLRNLTYFDFTVQYSQTLLCQQ